MPDFQIVYIFSVIGNKNPEPEHAHRARAFPAS